MDFGQYFLLGLLLALVVLFGFMIRPFLIPIIVAAVFCSLFQPLYALLLRWTRGRAGLSAMLCCIVVLLVVLIPLFLVVNVFMGQAIEFLAWIAPQIEELVVSGDLAPQELASHPLVQRLRLDQVDWRSPIQEGISLVSAQVGKLVNATSRMTFAFFSSLLIIAFTMFFFFRDGDRILARVLAYLPLEDARMAELAARFRSISRATVKGSLILGMVQGSLGGLTLWVFGFRAAVMWGMVMAVLSVLPLVGSYVVLVPAALYQMGTGHLGSGIAILVICLVVISNIDNLLRPRLVGRDVGMHDLMVFFSTLGGIAFFGVMGFIVGPLVASLLMALLGMYSQEFETEIRQRRPAPGAADVSG